MSLRLEKSYGTWFREYRPIYTPLEGGITALHQARPRVHRAGRARGRGRGAAGRTRRLVAFVVEPDPDDPADVIGDEPIWHDGAVVGWVTSGGYGHHVKQSIALGLRADRAGDAGRPGRRRVRDRDHRPTAAGAAPARAAVRPDRAPGCASDRGRRRPPAGRIVVDGAPVAFEAGRLGRARDPARRRGPGRGGTLCLAGDCGNCLAEVDGIAYVRTCQTAGTAGVAGRAASGRGESATPRGGRHGPDGRRRCRSSGRAAPPRGRRRGHRRRIERAGRGRRGGTGRQVRPRPRRARGRRGRRDLRRADDRRPDRRTACSTSMPHEIVVATGAAEIQPVCPGNRPGRDRDRACRRDSSRAAGVEHAGRGRRRSTAASSASRARTAASGPS